MLHAVRQMAAEIHAPSRKGPTDNAIRHVPLTSPHQTTGLQTHKVCTSDAATAIASGGQEQVGILSQIWAYGQIGEQQGNSRAHRPAFVPVASTRGVFAASLIITACTPPATNPKHAALAVRSKIRPAAASSGRGSAPRGCAIPLSPQGCGRCALAASSCFEDGYSCS